MKGHLFNLIVYTHEKRRFDYFHNVIKSFIEKYPCRVIFIRSDNNQNQNFLEKSKTPEEFLENSYDLFSINVSRSLLHKVPFVILPQLIPDLPIYLVWGQNPISDNEILPQLQKLATRFVFDSECAKDLKIFSSKMLEKIANLKIDFMDVSWAEIGGWRDAIAQTFQSPDKLALLHLINKIVIKYNNLEAGTLRHSAIQAIYLQGWLAAELKWGFKSIVQSHTMTLNYESPQSTIEVILQPQIRKTLAQGKIFEVEFQCTNAVKISMTLAEKQSKVMIYFSTEEKCELPFSLPIQDLSKGLNAMKEIFYNRTSPHYTDMLNVLKQIPWDVF